MNINQYSKFKSQTCKSYSFQVQVQVASVHCVSRIVSIRVWVGSHRLLNGRGINKAQGRLAPVEARQSYGFESHDHPSYEIRVCILIVITCLQHCCMLTIV